ncbi:MAG: MBL fold metallo-hydrolase [Ignavibacteriaceae bacterium]
MTRKILSLLLILMTSLPLYAQNNFTSDTVETSDGELVITFIGHGTLMFGFSGKIIHVDPFSKLADYSSLPKADLILITHHHGDHLDPDAINQIKTADTKILLNKLSAEKISNGIIINNGETKTEAGIKIEAVPAYNLVHKRDNGEPFHAKGECNGYVISFGDKEVYVAGDTENTPEMKALKGIDIAFLPMNLPYTMTPEMVADAAKAFKPAVLYPYHYGETNISEIKELMKDTKDVELRIRPMK